MVQAVEVVSKTAVEVLEWGPMWCWVTPSDWSLLSPSAESLLSPSEEVAWKCLNLHYSAMEWEEKGGIYQLERRGASGW
jgi:hypothetical protein